MPESLEQLYSRFSNQEDTEGGWVGGLDKMFMLRADTKQGKVN